MLDFRKKVSLKFAHVCKYLCFCPLIASIFISNIVVPQAYGANVGNAAYEAAQKAMVQKNFAESTRLFYQLVTQTDGDIKTKSMFGLAESLRQLNLPQSAAYFFIRIAQEGTKNPFFRIALDQIANINATESLGRASIASLFDGRSHIEPLSVPAQARGFYFFYKGLDLYEREKAAEAKAEFLRVPKDSPYYGRAQYYTGVLASISKDLDLAKSAFSAAAQSATRDNFKQLAILALARIYYERKEIRRSFEYYSQIPRDSDLWLETLFEGAWAFFLIQKPNNTLGNIHSIHSPFYESRFFPESYILEAITYLRLCYFQKVDIALKKFQERYKPTFVDLNKLLKKYKEQYNAFFNLNLQYRSTGDLREFPAAREIIDSVSRSDAFKEAIYVVRSIDREEKHIARNYASRWENTGLMDVLRRTFDERKSATITRTGQELFSQTVQAWKYLKDLSEQTRLIQYERTTRQTDQLRSMFNPDDFQVDNSAWGEGMKPLNLSKELEYWPFEGEYWEDEIGGYVYNLESKCGASAQNKSSNSKK